MRITAVQARAVGRAVLYIAASGEIETAYDGSRSWRNNNPGNLRPGPFATRRGSIGTAGGFAIFPTPQVGWNALLSLLKNYSGRGLTLDQAIARYAPPVENDTIRYLSVTAQALGVPSHTPLRSLTSTQFETLAAAIRRHEGWIEGSRVLKFMP